MNLTVTLEYRFDRTPDGSVWTQTGYDHYFWMRYLVVFDHVRVLARVREVNTVPADSKRAGGEGISFASIPYYLGPWQYLLQLRQIKKSAQRIVEPTDAVILRVPSQIATHVYSVLRSTGHPYGLEVVGDPYHVFAPDAVRHPLRPFFRWWFSHQLRRQCMEACAVAYVTKDALQPWYPSAAHAFTTHYSSIELRDEALVLSPRAVRSNRSTLKIVTVGSLAQLYKAPDILIDAVGKCLREGLDIELVLIGDGKHRAELETRAKALGLGKRVRFLGQLPTGETVRAQLDQANLFVLPSRTEGLPRAMIEAMARALPCIGSTAGGIPELLPSEDMVPPGDVAALAHKIHEVVANPKRTMKMSIRNLEKAKEYREEVLRERRISFYDHVRKETEAWLKTRP